ncbi:MAG: FAD-dependent oxidoreductase [Vallitalea sp.]|jgi:NAD(P)H-nitrite reductase large subunit/rubredoxin|nr:FAD-dependent oxidoreductase [Vallitalea sp.]
MKLWRCIICGEIFEGDEPPEICSVCGAPAEEFELYEEKEVTFSSDIDEKIVIIGNNAAGISAMEAIRKRNSIASITVIDKDQSYAYYRPSLSDYLSNSHDEGRFYLHNNDWYQENNINLLLGYLVTEIDKDNKKVILENMEEVEYDKLILANGSYNYVPPIEGIDKEGVFSIKTLSDANNVKEYAKRCRKVAVIGGGLLGLEASWELKKLGLDITVIEMASRILPKQLDEEGSQIFERGINKTGIIIHKNVTAKAIVGDNKVTGVQIMDGSIVDVDMVVLSIGVRANTKLAKDSGILISRSVIVDENMKTNIDNIYAAGDVCEIDGINYSIWAEAIEQGKIAGANAVGDNIIYKKIIPNNIFNGMNMSIFSIGDLGINENTSYTCIMQEDKDNLLYKKLYFVDDIFVGGILIGDISKSSNMISGIEQKLNLKQMVNEIIL